MGYVSFSRGSLVSYFIQLSDWTIYQHYLLQKNIAYEEFSILGINKSVLYLNSYIQFLCIDSDLVLFE